MKLRVQIPQRMGLRGQLIALVLLAIILTICAMTTLTFIGPPPRPGPVPMPVVSHILLTGLEPELHGKRFERNIQTSAPDAPAGMYAAPLEASRLAVLLKVPASRIRFYSNHQMMPYPGTNDLRRLPPQTDDHPVFGEFLAALHQKGSWIVLRSDPPPFWSPWLQSTAVLTLTLCALLLVPAFLVASQMARPLRQLSDHMSRYWDRPIPAPDASAPQEIHALIGTLSTMQGQIARHIDERTQMLVAIAHDLRTPLTRLAFRIEKLENGERVKAGHDLAEMRTMITSLLEFVSGDHNRTKFASLDLSALLATLVDNYADMGARITLSNTNRAIIQADGAAMSRLFSNLIDNALHYAGSVELTVEETPAHIRVMVADHGPGVPEALLDKIFEPFFRIDTARGDSAGNMGLGLATARNIAEHHGGHLTAKPRPSGGLTMEVTLPRIFRN